MTAALTGARKISLGTGAKHGRSLRRVRAANGRLVSVLLVQPILARGRISRYLVTRTELASNDVPVLGEVVLRVRIVATKQEWGTVLRATCLWLYGVALLLRIRRI